MITKTDLYMAFQKERGNSLDNILKMVPSKDNKAYTYVDWLENLLLMAANSQQIEL
jgi:hypothetical protein